MITPRFDVAQDDDSVTITIRAPYCDLNELDVDINETTFVFYCSPYFLRLVLPGKIVETDRSACKFDADAQEFVFRIDKVTKGERFVDLDMVTKLLSPVADKFDKVGPSIEVISSSDDVEERPIENLVFNLSRLKIHPDSSAYGFMERRTGYLDGVRFELTSVLDSTTIPNINLSCRKDVTDEYVRRAFDPKHYLCDLYDEHIDVLIDFQSPWSTIDPGSVEFGAEELDVLKDFPNREYLVDEHDLRSVYLGLVDILFAYCYDMRCWSFEPTVESAWAYNRISPILSAFVKHEDLRSCLIACFRRALTLPLFRNFELCTAALGDVGTLLKLGKKKIVQSLLEIYGAFNSAASSQPRYVLNELYIKDYVIFVQKCDARTIEEIRKEIELMLVDGTIERKDLGLGLDEIEARAVDEILNGESDTDSDDTDTDSDDTDDSSDQN